MTLSNVEWAEGLDVPEDCKKHIKNMAINARCQANVQQRLALKTLRAMPVEDIIEQWNFHKGNHVKTGEPKPMLVNGKPSIASKEAFLLGLGYAHIAEDNLWVRPTDGATYFLDDAYAMETEAKHD